MKFRKRVKILPGVVINLSRSGVSTTIGPKGVNVNIGKKGAYLNTGIPGTGLYNRKKIADSKKSTDNTFTTNDFQEARSASNYTRNELEEKGYKPALTKTDNYLMEFLILIGSFILYPIGTLYYGITGVKRIFSKTVFYYTFKNVAITSTDRRYKDGYRIDGYEMKKVYLTAKFPATPLERKKLILKGVLRLSIAVFILYTGITIFHGTTIETNSETPNEVVLETITKATISAKTGLHLRSEPTPSGAIIMTIPFDEEVDILESADGWAKVNYQKQTGWVSSKYLK
ncbi:DUF4236 domain-containing protein [Marinigracilibium pacificum]|uniref:DUF4236 domain-containing protein n=1 Tax=Marinigracilibium pacificum TaxID=2729599 RepID=UPI00232A4C5C|nr:DUF4236 domain-containing protein [Marinigracilibium pacificum]